MHDSIITPNLLGPYHDHTYPLQVGSVQQMSFQSDDIGPCYLNEKERNDKKHDRDTGIVRKCDVLKNYLWKASMQSGIVDPPCRLKKITGYGKGLQHTYYLQYDHHRGRVDGKA